MEFDPRGIYFDFDFSYDECDEIKYGVCPLVKYQSILVRNDFDFETERDKFPLCISIFFGLRDNTFRREAPELVLFDCGHYEFSDGRHRICVAQKTDLKLNVNIELAGGFCDKCRK